MGGTPISHRQELAGQAYSLRSRRVCGLRNRTFGRCSKGRQCQIYWQGCIANFIRKSYEKIYITRTRVISAQTSCLPKYLKEATKSFLYKNDAEEEYHAERKDTGKRAAIRRRCASVVLAKKRYKNFRGEESAEVQAHGPLPRMLPNQRRQKLDIIYEDADILLLNKPVGMLSQKAQPQDISAVEYLISYLLRAGSLLGGASAPPSVCNRLDRTQAGY